VPSSIQSIDYAKLRQDFVKAVARLCPGWLANQRDDLVQAAVMRVMQIVSRRSAGDNGEAHGDDPKLAAAYLYRVAHSALVDEIRRANRRQETALDDSSVDRVAITFQDPERDAASREIGRNIHACLATMHRDRRQAVALYLQGHSVPEAARLLDWPAKRTENLVYRGLADLRECLMAKGIEP
jgi:RNA polymerase sigma-70 factor, ECF subfamily